MQDKLSSLSSCQHSAVILDGIQEKFFYSPCSMPSEILFRYLKQLLFISQEQIQLLSSFSIDTRFIICKCRLLKYWLKGEKAGISEVFAILPGFPDNVRTNAEGNFWVAVHCRRNFYSYLCAIYPKLRMFLLKLPIPTKIQYLLHIGGRLHAVAVKYSPEGKLLQVLEDSQGKVVKAISEIEEKDGKLWMGSVLMPFIGVYSLA